MVFTYEEHINKLEKCRCADTIDGYFYVKSSISNSPSNNRFEDITFNLLSKLKSKSPNSSQNSSPTVSPIPSPSRYF
jgi:hypothetical protein